MDKQTVELGDEVECKLTGYKGLVVGVTKYITGCDRAEVRGPLTKDGKIGDSWSLDIPALTIIKKAKVKIKDVQNSQVAVGGPPSAPMKRP